MNRDLLHAYSYLRIAEAYREARQHDQALVWAEKGLKAFPERTDGRLREFAAEEYHRRSRHEDAMKLMQTEFFGAAAAGDLPDPGTSCKQGGEVVGVARPCTG